MNLKAGIFTLTISSVCALQAVAAPATQEQMAHWQAEIKSQLNNQIGASIQKQYERKFISDERMHQLQGQVRMLATDQEAYQRHQIGRYCRDEVITLCSGMSLTDPHLGICLSKNEPKLSKQCRTVISDGYTGEPTKADMYHHDVLIPAGSRYYYIPTERALGIKLSRNTNFQGLEVTQEITWYEAGQIRSFIPAGAPVMLEKMVFATGAEVTFFPNGQVKKGTLHRAVNLGGQAFSVGQTISRQSPTSNWRSH